MSKLPPDEEAKQRLANEGGKDVPPPMKNPKRQKQIVGGQITEHQREQHTPHIASRAQNGGRGGGRGR